MFDSTIEFFADKQYKNPYILKRKGQSFLFKFFRLLFLIGLSYLFLFPLLYMFITTFQDPATTSDPSVIWIPKSISFEGLSGAWESLNYKNTAPLTAIITIFGTGASIVSCSMVGYGFARFKFPLQNAAFVLVLLTIIVPPQTIIMSSYLNFYSFDFGGLLSLFGAESTNLLGSAWVFVLPAIFATGIRNGLYIFIFRQFFAGQPKDLEEAARIDGCGPFKTFIRIMVPLAGPAFVTVLLFSIVWHWNDYYSSSIYFVDAVRPISVMLKGLEYDLSVRGQTAYVIRMYLQAGALLSILPPLLLYCFTQKFFTESIERTGLVG